MRTPAAKRTPVLSLGQIPIVLGAGLGQPPRIGLQEGLGKELKIRWRAPVCQEHHVNLLLAGLPQTLRFAGECGWPTLRNCLEQLAQRFHVELKFAVSDQSWLKKGKRAIAWNGDRQIAGLGALSSEVQQTFDIKGDVYAAEVDIAALLASQKEWKMAPVARFPGVPMILAVTHGHDLEYHVDAGRVRRSS